jgi:hypothetical protein
MPPMRRHPQAPPFAVTMPEGRPPHPGVVVGAEAYGVNPFIQVVQQRRHSFSAPWGPLRHDEADRAAWDDAVAFLRAHTEG